MNYESCPIEGWYQEIVTRMHEAHAAGSSVVNLSWTHQRGYIPNQILRRPKIRELLKEWAVDNSRTPSTEQPPALWIPVGWAGVDLNTCPLQPFIDEISLRETEARSASGVCPILDTTAWHPRGGIPDPIMHRLERRRSQEWLRKTREEIAHLYGLANKDDSFAQTQQERTDAVEDPTRLEAAAKELRARAEQYRAQARWLTEELG
jgi:hypothetical protein